MKKILLLILLTLSSISAFSQIKATTEDGRKVLLNENGSWKFEISSTTVANSHQSFNCEDLIIEETDKVTGKSTVSGKDLLIVGNNGDKKLGFIFVKGNSSIIIGIQAIGASGCVDDKGKVNILFRDGSRLELINNGKFNCDGMNTQYLGGSFGKKKELELLCSKEIETMRVWTLKDFVEQDFTSEQSMIFMKTVNCLANY